MPKKTPIDIPLKNNYSSFEFPDVLIHVSGDVKKLLYMLKEYESKKNDTKVNNNDILIMLCSCYMDVHDLDFWNPENPQHKRVGGLLNNG